MKKDATTEDRRDKSGMALHLVKEAIDALHARSPNSTSTAVRKLQTAAILIDNKALAAWCDFQLGKLEHLISNGKNEDIQVYASRLCDKLDEHKIPFTAEELLPRLSEAGGNVSSIEFIEDILNQIQKEKRGNDGTHYQQNLRRVISATANAAAIHANRLYASLAFGEIPRQYFDLIRERVDNLLLDICPETIEQFMTAYERLSGGREDWSLALTSCRRIIKAVADVIYPPKNGKVAGREIGDQQYINRIRAFLDENIASSSDKDLAKAHIGYLGSFIEEVNKKTSKGVHSVVNHEEAVRTVLYTYLTIGDILDFTPESVFKALKEKGKLNINSASIEEMLSVPGMTNSIAKQIVKRRVKRAFSSIEELQELKGVGPSTVQKLGVAMIALPTT
ncbi:MAG: helix-hairpin-helix domain-containing protein [Gemmatimonadota bacterium]|nr:helix-hairpin-helix domain-containing protein [Gemmatimonadota bacterium]